MTDDMMTLQTLLAKQPDADVLREMIGFAAQRLMELEVGAKSGRRPSRGLRGPPGGGSPDGPGTAGAVSGDRARWLVTGRRNEAPAPRSCLA